MRWGWAGFPRGAPTATTCLVRGGRRADMGRCWFRGWVTWPQAMGMPTAPGGWGTEGTLLSGLWRDGGPIDVLAVAQWPRFRTPGLQNWERGDVCCSRQPGRGPTLQWPLETNSGWPVPVSWPAGVSSCAGLPHGCVSLSCPRAWLRALPRTWGAGCVVSAGVPPPSVFLPGREVLTSPSAAGGRWVQTRRTARQPARLLWPSRRNPHLVGKPRLGACGASTPHPILAEML